jgi:hypothetical protein
MNVSTTKMHLDTKVGGLFLDGGSTKVISYAHMLLEVSWRETKRVFLFAAANCCHRFESLLVIPRLLVDHH